MAQLIVLDGPDMGKEFSLGKVDTLGSDLANTIYLADRRIPDTHARVERDGESWVLTPVCDEPAVLVNNEPIAEWTLSHGDMITLVDTILLFSDEDDPESSPPLSEISDSDLPVIEEDGMESQIQDRLRPFDGDTAMLSSFRGTPTAERKFEALYKVASLISKVFDLEVLLDGILEIVFEFVPADRGFILMVDEEQQRLVPMSSRTRAGGPSQEPPRISRTILRTVFETRESLRLTDALTDDRFSGGASIKMLNIRAAMCVPLVGREGSDVLGVIHVDTGSVQRTFTSPDLDLLTAIAWQAAVVVEKARIYKRHKEYLRKLEQLGKETQKLNTWLQREPILRELAKAACAVTGATRSSVVVKDPATANLVVVAGVGMEKEREGDASGLHTQHPQVPHPQVERGRGLARRVFESRQPLLVADAKQISLDAPIDKNIAYKTDSFLIVPIFAKVQGGDERAPVMGVINVTDKGSGGTFTPDDQEILTILATQAGIALSNAELYERATVDALTRVFVRRHFFQVLEQEVERAEARGTPLSLIMLDLDHFKAKNDTYGHPAGDRILSEAGALLKRCVREGTEGFIVARYGGEEFAVMLPKADLELAARVAERIRDAVDRHIFMEDELRLNCTVSLGVAQFQLGESMAQLIKRADQALYAAKQGGRNRVAQAD